jgi:hypothetical protein
LPHATTPRGPATAAVAAGRGAGAVAVSDDAAHDTDDETGFVSASEDDTSDPERSPSPNAFSARQPESRAPLLQRTRPVDDPEREAARSVILGAALARLWAAGQRGPLVAASGPQIDGHVPPPANIEGGVAPMPPLVPPAPRPAPAPQTAAATNRSWAGAPRSMAPSSVPAPATPGAQEPRPPASAPALAGAARPSAPAPVTPGAQEPRPPASAPALAGAARPSAPAPVTPGAQEPRPPASAPAVAGAAAAPPASGSFGEPGGYLGFGFGGLVKPPVNAPQSAAPVPNPAAPQQPPVASAPPAPNAERRSPESTAKHSPPIPANPPAAHAADDGVPTAGSPQLPSTPRNTSHEAAVEEDATHEAAIHSPQSQELQFVPLQPSSPEAAPAPVAQAPRAALSAEAVPFIAGGQGRAQPRPPAPAQAAPASPAPTAAPGRGAAGRGTSTVQDPPEGERGGRGRKRHWFRNKPQGS